MRKDIVLTLTGPDRIGIVEAVTKLLLEYDANVEASRMARLGGEFAMLMLVSVPEEQLVKLDQGVKNLIGQGYKITTTPTTPIGEKFSGWLPYQIEVNGADHEGIVHQVAEYLTRRGINIEAMDTSVAPAPMSGTPFFSMIATVIVPDNLPNRNWESDLDDVGHHLNVDIKISPVKK